MADVIVVGAGLAGLVTAHRLVKQGVDVVLVERAPVAGGQVRTEKRNGWRHECGPNSFQGSADPVFTLADEFKLVPVKARAAADRQYLYLDGALRKLPQTPGEAVASPLLPASAKMRLLAEPLTLSKARSDESVREFFESRFGSNVVDRFVEPFVSGIYGGDIAQLGVAAAFPRLYAMAREHGSLLRAAYALARRNEAPGRRGTYSFAGGLGDLTDALVSSLADRIHLNEQVLVRRQGGEWRVGKHRGRSLVLASPAWASARLVHGELPTLATELTTIDYAPLVSVHLLYRRDAVPRALDAMGVLVPRSEGPRTLGVWWPSALFDCCDGEHVVLSCLVGGVLDRGAVGLGPDELVSIVRRDLRRMMGISQAPEDVSVVKHEHALPQYSTRHVSWRARVTDIVARHRGLYVTGNWLEGTSMGDTIAHAEKTAAGVLARMSE